MEAKIKTLLNEFVQKPNNLNWQNQNKKLLDEHDLKSLKSIQIIFKNKKLIIFEINKNDNKIAFKLNKNGKKEKKYRGLPHFFVNVLPQHNRCHWAVRLERRNN